MKNNTMIKNRPAPFKIFYGSSFKFISKWLIDKVVISKNGKVKKLEFYNYFDRKDIKPLLRFLKTKAFSYEDNSSLYPRIFNILKAQEGKNIIKGGKIVNKNHYKYFYLVDHVSCISHRGRILLLRMYWNESQNSKHFKVELTYSYYKKGYYLHFLDYISAMKGINEVIKKLEKRFSPMAIDYNKDFSGKISMDSFFHQVMGNIGKSNINHIYKIFDILTETRK